MNRRLPPDALGFYLNLGPARSYEKVAQQYGVSKRTVTTTATRERWQDHLAQADRKAREQMEERYVDAVQEANDRHIRLGRFLQNKGIAAFEGPMGAAEGIRAIKIGVEIERLGLGEPTERTATAVEDLIRREYLTCMTVVEDDGREPAQVETATRGRDEPDDADG
jgi:hypothetical protein